MTGLAGGAALALGCGETRADEGADQNIETSSPDVVTSNMNMSVYDAGLSGTADASEDGSGPGPGQDAEASADVVTSNMNMPIYDAGLDGTGDASDDGSDVVTSNMNMPVYDAGLGGTDAPEGDGSG